MVQLDNYLLSGLQSLQRCEHPDGCDRGAIAGPVKRCSEHGGGRRCEHLNGYDKGVIVGLVKRCPKHGGGPRCEHPDGCDRLRQEVHHARRRQLNVVKRCEIAVNLMNVNWGWPTLGLSTRKNNLRILSHHNVQCSVRLA